MKLSFQNLRNSQQFVLNFKLGSEAPDVKTIKPLESNLNLSAFQVEEHLLILTVDQNYLQSMLPIQIQFILLDQPQFTLLKENKIKNFEEFQHSLFLPLTIYKFMSFEPEGERIFSVVKTLQKIGSLESFAGNIKRQEVEKIFPNLGEIPTANGSQSLLAGKAKSVLGNCLVLVFLDEVRVKVEFFGTVINPASMMLIETTKKVFQFLNKSFD